MLYIRAGMQIALGLGLLMLFDHRTCTTHAQHMHTYTAHVVSCVHVKRGSPRGSTYIFYK